MNKINKLIALFLLGVVYSYGQNKFVDSGEVWKYLDNGSNQGTSWRALSFNDNLWKSGASQLGYGDGDETTVVSFGPSSTQKYATTYFRKEFTVADPTQYQVLLLEAIRDDGMVVYINNQEVWADNITMPYSYTKHATSAVGGATERDWISKTIASVLVAGTNVIAVEVHQANFSSSDLSFDFRLTGFDSLDPKVVRGPYLQSGTSNSVIVKWRTDVPSKSTIIYGTSLNSLNNTIVEEGIDQTKHEVVLTNLNPNTKYYYEISHSGSVYYEKGSDVFVKTAPKEDAKQFIRAWILGDPGTANQSQKNVRDAYYNYVATTTKSPSQTDMILFLGDNAYNNGTDSEYQSAMFDIYDAKLKNTVAWSCLGNHDGHSANATTQLGPYYDIFSFPKAGEAGGVASGTESYYSFDYGNIHFIVLESHQLHNNAAQMAWCTSDIQSTTKDWIVAFFHHPPYTKGSHDSDSSTDSSGALINMRNNFLPILEANGVDLVLSGHSHSYERSYFINGHYGFSNTFDKTSHIVGTNGDLSGREDTLDGAYGKSDTDTKGAVYITTGSAGKISGGSLNHAAMYKSLNFLGSCVLEVENIGESSQNMTVKFIKSTGNIHDYFTIHKTGIELSIDDIVESSETQVKLFPNPASEILNIELASPEKFKSASVFNSEGKLLSTTKTQKIHIENLLPAVYFVKIDMGGVFLYRKFIKR